MRYKILTFIMAFAILLGSFALSYRAQSAGGAYSETVSVIQGKADTVQLKGEVADILVANPEIADVGTLRTDRLYIVGRGIGDTNILAYDEFGNQLANINVHVRVDDKTLQDSLKSFFPNESISARTVNDNIVLNGMVSSASVANQVRDLAARFITRSNQTVVDLMNVKGDQQVMLKVKILEAKRSALKEIGVRMRLKDGNTPTSGLGFDTADLGATATTPFGVGSLVVGGNNSWGPVEMLMRGLETQGLINILAEPNLTAISGETAGFLAGGEYPIPTGRDDDGNITLEFKPFGVSLNFTPTVLNSKRIALQLSTEVSEKDPSNGLTIVSTKIDGLSVRRAQTTVELGSGSTIMIAGLMKSDSVDGMSGLPGAKDLPVLGALFRSKSFQRNESELLIMVTPYLVEPYAAAEAVEASAEPNVLENNLQNIKEAHEMGVAKQEDNEIGKLAPSKKIISMPESKVAQLYSEKPMPLAKEAVKADVAVARKPAVLAKGFINSMKSAYGQHFPQNFNNNARVGYIVD